MRIRARIVTGDLNLCLLPSPVLGLQVGVRAVDFRPFWPFCSPGLVLDCGLPCSVRAGEESLTGVVDEDVHVFVDDVVKSFDTADRNISVLLGWFRHVYFECHARVRVWFQLAAGLGARWTWDGGGRER